MYYLFYNDVTLEINMNTRFASFHLYNRDSEHEESIDVDLSMSGHWKWLNLKLKQLALTRF